jgi:energy-coupling factor transport system ATP-binding protein
MLEFIDLTLRYAGQTEPEHPAICDVSFTVEPGQWVVLLGGNGSGKSTLARLSNGLLLPQQGRVVADGISTVDQAQLNNLRSLVGVVGQDPDNQIICTTVFDEVAFGPQNLGWPVEQIRDSVDRALQAVGLVDVDRGTVDVDKGTVHASTFEPVQMWTHEPSLCPHQHFAKRDPNTLSGGEKQRLVIAAVLAMDPRYLVLDEPTSLLDPMARSEVMATIEALHQSGRGILQITHNLEQAQQADKVVVLDNGQVVYQGQPGGILNDKPALERYGLISHSERNSSCVILSEGAAVVEGSPSLQQERRSFDYAPYGRSAQDDTRGFGAVAQGGTSLSLVDASYAYAAGTPQQHWALRNIDLTLQPGCCTLLVGSSGSGKSTLLRIAAGLLEPTSGEVEPKLKPGQAGLVFQQPEAQLFAQTVADDIAFGPKNLGLISNAKQREQLVEQSLAAVGLEHQQFKDRSPFTLSGGEARRVAIAGVLAMQPQFLLLDEPTAGLDGKGCGFIYRLIASQCQQGTAVLVVTHSPEQLRGIATEVLYLENGNLSNNGGDSICYRQDRPATPCRGDHWSPTAPQAPRAANGRPYGQSDGTGNGGEPWL